MHAMSETDDSADQSAEAGSARTAIDAILKVDTTQTSIETLFSLIRLESKGLHPYTYNWKLEIELTSKLCCFHMSKLPSWTCHTVCGRCQQLNLLMQSEWCCISLFR